MKGFVLYEGSERVCGGAESGVVNVLISNKEFDFRLHFGGMNAEQEIRTWYARTLVPGDRISIGYETFDEASAPQRLGSGRNTPEDDLRLLETYRRMKRELIAEGLLAEDAEPER